MTAPFNGSIENPQDVNKFITEQTALLLGAETIPVIGDAGTVTAPNGMCFYYIQADGAANVVISSMTNLKDTTIVIGTPPLTVLAGGLLPLVAVKSFVVSSGKYIAFLKNI
jgi:hypothetical protein